MNNPVIIVTPTIQDGVAVRWYRDVRDATDRRPVLTASRNGVKVGQFDFLTDIPDAWVEAAKAAYQRLKSNPDADASGLATHRHDRFPNGPIVPITPSAKEA